MPPRNEIENKIAHIIKRTLITLFINLTIIIIYWIPPIFTLKPYKTHIFFEKPRIPKYLARIFRESPSAVPSPRKKEDRGEVSATKKDLAAMTTVKPMGD